MLNNLLNLWTLIVGGALVVTGAILWLQPAVGAPGLGVAALGAALISVGLMLGCELGWFKARAFAPQPAAREPGRRPNVVRSSRDLPAPAHA